MIDIYLALSQNDRTLLARSSLFEIAASKPCPLAGSEIPFDFAIYA
jgi:hypothetical protein